ncbi:MAG: HVO_2523 family zinc finger protein [Haloarculaceae archaeon]
MTDTGDDPTVGVRGRPCPLCGADMTHRHCEYVCPRHGVVYDCSDTFY